MPGIRLASLGIPTPKPGPSRALLIAAGVLTQLMGAVCLVLALASLPVAHDLNLGTAGTLASVVAALAAIICGGLLWRGRLVAIGLAAGVDIGFGIGLPRGGSAIGAMLRLLPASESGTADTLVMVAAITMFIAAALCALAVPSALRLRNWARNEIRNPVAHEAKPSATLRGMGVPRLRPSQVLRPTATPQRRAFVIAGVAVSTIAIGVVVIAAATISREAATGTVDALDPPLTTRLIDGAILVSSDAAPPQTIAELAAQLHAALATGQLAPLLDERVFAFGVGAHDLAEGRDAVIARLREDLRLPRAVSVTFSHLASEGDGAWLAEELRVGDTPFVISAVAARRGGTWTIAALHWATAMANPTAYRLARTGELAVPDAIPDAHDTSPLVAAMRAAFASRSSFVAAASTRDDAFNFGSAGERVTGGSAIKKLFARIKATIRLHDAVKVGNVAERVGWGVANVDFTDGDVTQTFRVLAAWVHEDAGWRLVLTHWSNAR